MADPIPDPNVVGVQAEAMLEWHKLHPHNTIDELMEFSDILHDWFGRPTTWLSGEIPAEVAKVNPIRALTAAKRWINQYGR